MKALNLISTGILSAVLMILTSHAMAATSLEASLNDPKWNGTYIPKDQRCQKYGGINPMTPEIKITGIPQGTEAIILIFNDESFARMSYGGHGIIGMLVEPGITELIFPSIPGHSFELPDGGVFPDGVFMVSAHRAPGWDKAGAYLPPCSGGNGNRYTVIIQPSKIKNMDKKKFKKIARVRVNMGRY